MIGGFGDAEVFSFHATKFLNTFEGGAVVTNDDELARKIRLMKNFGFAGYDNVVYIGTNGKMTRDVGGDGPDVAREHRRVRRGQPPATTRSTRDGLAGVPGARVMRLRRARDDATTSTSSSRSTRPRAGISRDQLRRAAARRERARAPLLLPRLPPHGAVPLVLPQRRAAAAVTRAVSRPRAVAADGHRRRPRHDRAGVRDRALRHRPRPEIAARLGPSPPRDDDMALLASDASRTIRRS